MMKKIIIILNAFFIFVALTSCSNNLVQTNLLNNSFVFDGTNLLNQVLVKRIEKKKQQEEIEKWRNEHLIATSKTTFDPAQLERTNNIKLAAKSINGLILNPNEEFSFNKIVGRRTVEKGYLPADIIVGSKKNDVAKAPGGGICQVSTTLCMAVLNCNIQIVERNFHSQEVSYATPDTEAMINWGTSDFRFINTFDFSIQIEILFNKTENMEEIICNIFSL